MATSIHKGRIGNVDFQLGSLPPQQNQGSLSEEDEERGHRLQWQPNYKAEAFITMSLKINIMP